MSCRSSSVTPRAYMLDAGDVGFVHTSLFLIGATDNPAGSSTRQSVVIEDVLGVPANRHTLFVPSKGISDRLAHQSLRFSYGKPVAPVSSRSSPLGIALKVVRCELIREL